MAPASACLLVQGEAYRKDPLCDAFPWPEHFSWIYISDLLLTKSQVAVTVAPASLGM
jgi:hypothetical protein